jgi:hypothetical protein
MSGVTKALFVSLSLIFAATFLGIAYAYRHLEGGLSQRLFWMGAGCGIAGQRTSRSRVIALGGLITLIGAWRTGVGFLRLQKTRP